MIKKVPEMLTHMIKARSIGGLFRCLTEEQSAFNDAILSGRAHPLYVEDLSNIAVEELNSREKRFLSGRDLPEGLVPLGEMVIVLGFPYRAKFNEPDDVILQKINTYLGSGPEDGSIADNIIACYDGGFAQRERLYLDGASLTDLGASDIDHFGALASGFYNSLITKHFSPADSPMRKIFEMLGEKNPELHFEKK